MHPKMITRRQALSTGLGFFSATLVGCGNKENASSSGIASALEEMPASTHTPPKLGWETIASGKYGPGVRSRHGLVFDQKAKAAVLFGGVVWTPDWNLKNDTWELHGRKWSQIKTSDSPPARHRGAMVYLDNPALSQKVLTI
jgi:hypothetical protein